MISRPALMSALSFRCQQELDNENEVVYGYKQWFFQSASTAPATCAAPLATLGQAAQAVEGCMGLDFETCSAACKRDLVEVGDRATVQGREGTGLPIVDSLQQRLTCTPARLPACLPAGGVALRASRQSISGPLSCVR